MAAMPGKRRFALCFEGLYYSVVLAFIMGGGILRGINLLFVLAGMMLGPLIYNIRMVDLMLRRIKVRRILPDGICAGDLLVVEFETEGIARRGSSSAILVRDSIKGTQSARVPLADAENRPEVFFPHVAAGQKEIQSYQGRLMDRGRYTFGPFEVSTRFPLGLVKKSITVQQTEDLIVFPRPGILLPRWKRLSEAQFVGAGGGRSRQGLVEGDFYGLRDYRKGDSRSWIHWRTSARRNTLAVRQFEQPRSQDVALLLDLWLPEQPSDEQRDNIELAISFAAAVAEDLCRQGGNRLGIGVAGKEVAWKYGIGSRTLLTEIMEQLALAEGTADDQFPTLLEQSLQTIPSGTTTVVLSTRSIDMRDTERFAQVWDDPNLRNALREIHAMEVGSDEFGECFDSDLLAF